MGCIYENNGDGYCLLSDIDENGEYSEVCVYSDDPDPSYGCENYQSDYTCYDCGADLNIEECKCDE